MSQILFTKEIAVELRELAWNALKTSLSLQMCNVGDVAFYANPRDLSARAPCIFVKPNPGVKLQMRTQSKLYTVTYSFRVQYVGKFNVADKVVENKVANTGSIAEVFFNNFTLSNLSLSNGIIESQHPTEILYDPIEDAYMQSLNANLYATAIVLQVVAHTSTP